jgi:hypothetical protein
MKTLAFIDGKNSFLLFEDDVVVKIYNDLTRAHFPNNSNLIIGQCKDSNAVLHENVTPPSDWISNKYLYDPSASPKWSINPKWGFL